MPTYLGGKKRFGKIFGSIINSYQPKIFLEPFLGGCNILPYVNTDLRIGSDIFGNIIHFYNDLQKGWLPPEQITKDDYYTMKDNPHNYTKGLLGYVSTACSYGGKQWGGFANPRLEINRDYTKGSYKVAVDLSKKIRLSDQFLIADYRSFKPKNAVIYCDPPYKGTTKYKYEIDHVEFWEVMRKWSKDNIVLISEYSAPDDFEIIWSKETKNQFSTNKTIRTEKLFKLGG